MRTQSLRGPSLVALWLGAGIVGFSPLGTTPTQAQPRYEVFIQPAEYPYENGDPSNSTGSTSSTTSSTATGSTTLAPYTTDIGVNDVTYGDTVVLPVPFDTGFVWATMLWEVYWNLVDALGFEPDLHEPTGAGGNQLALQLVMDGLALQPCSPGFVDGRDAILLADVARTGGANECRLWRAFARRGLGLSANQGTSASVTDNVEAFDVPAACETVVFADGFESGDTSAWSTSMP